LSIEDRLIENQAFRDLQLIINQQSEI